MKEKKQYKIRWDKKSTLRLILMIFLISAFFFIVLYLPSKLRDSGVSDYDGRTTGNLISIKANDYISQGRTGQHESTDSYDITFYYTVNSKTYTNTNNIKNSGKYAKFVTNVYKTGLNMTINIGYMTSNPQESIIVIDE